MKIVLPLLLASALAGGSGADQAATDVDIKAAFLYNFVKFAEWPGLAGREPIVVCALNDTPMAAALSELTRDQTIDAHRIEVRTVEATAAHACQLLFVSSRTPDMRHVLSLVNGGATLTVSDARGFAGGGGMIELFVERDRLRFAIDVGVVQRSGVKLSSRLLGLAVIVGDDRAK